MSDTRLLFVYNADSGLLNALKDAIHKVASPGTYPCSLCATTYGAVSMRREWRDHVKRLPHQAVFLHRDEFRRDWPLVSEPLPAIFLQREGRAPVVLVAAAEMPPGQRVEVLIALIDRKLAAQPGQAE